MNPNKCQCHKAPCICGTGLCKGGSFADSAKIENIDENGNTHYVESIYQKISLSLFENMECCVAQKPNDSPGTNAPDTDNLELNRDSILSPIIKEEEEEESNDCIECCEQIYCTSLPDQKHDCKDECNITAELYCQIRRQNAEPGEKFSDCSLSSSEDSDESDDDDDDDDNENIGEGSTEYESARGRFEDNSETTLEDEDYFNPNSEPQRIYCQNKSCCSLNQLHKCKHNISGDFNKQNEEMPKDTTEATWTTIPLKSSRNKKPKHHQIQKEKEDTNKQTAKDDDSQGNADMRTNNMLQFFDQNISSGNTPILKTNENSDSTMWKTIAPEYKMKPIKSVSMAKDLKESISTEMNLIVNNRKRKYGSIPNVLPNTSIRFEEDSQDDFSNLRQERKSLSGRKKRVTLSNFLTEEHLKEEQIIPDTNILSKPEHTDAIFLLGSSESEDNKRLWKSYEPCDRSDYSIFAVESLTRKPKKGAHVEQKPKPVNTLKRAPQQSFLRIEKEPFRPTKFLCFKFVPTVSPTTSLTSTMIQDHVIGQIAIDPPDSLRLSTDIPQTKFQGSRIPVAQSKYKTAKKHPSEFDMKRTPSDEARSYRKQTLGLDELRNVMEQRCTSYRRSIIPPEQRKSIYSKKRASKKSLVFGTSFFEASTSRQPSDDDVPQKKQGKQVVLLERVDSGSDTSLRNKMKQYYPEDDTPVPLAASTPKKIIKNPINVGQKQGKANKAEKSEEIKTKGKVPLAATTYNKSLEKINNALQKTCCSQTEIHVCVKESVFSEKGKEESNIIQMVNIDVTPKNSKFVKINVMPTVPEIDKEGIITIPVQFKLCNKLCEEETKMYTSTPETGSREELLYQENLANNYYEHYMEPFVREEREHITQQNIQEKPYVNLLWTKMKTTLSEPQKEEEEEEEEEDEAKTEEHDSVEIQTDLTLGQKLLSKSLNSLSNDDSSSSVQNKSEPVKKSGIDWNDIVLPPPGSFVIRKSPPKKAKRRFSGDSGKTKDNNIPSTSEGLPPTEEKKTEKETSEFVYSKNKLKCCCNLEKSHEEPYAPANKKSSEEEELPSSTEDEPKCKRSKIISLVFSESFYDIDNYSCSLHQKEEKLISPCTSKPEIPWTNILLETKPQIRKIEKLDISKTSTSITDQTFTDEYNSTSPSPKTTDTCPNLSENSTHTCDCSKNFNDKETNTSSEEDCEAAPNSNNMSTHSTDIMKAFKEDPVLSAFKAFEEELKPVRKALAEVQNKLRALNLPELECIFKKDPISEYAISRSNSQIAQNWEYKQPAISSDSRNPSHYCRQGPSEHFEYHRRPPCDNFKVYRFATPPLSVRSRNLSTDIWKSFGSYDRSTIKCPHEKYWKPPNLHNMQNVDSYNYPPYPSARYESSNSNPESNFHYFPFDSSGIKRQNEHRNCPYFRGMLDKRVEIINDDDDLDYPSTFRNTPIHSHVPHQECYCDSEHSLYSNSAERLNSNHALANLTPKYSSSFHTLTANYSNKYVPIKVRPVTQYYLPGDEELQNPKYISTRNTSIGLKNGKVNARTKIELPRTAYKRSNNMQKSVRKMYPPSNEKNHYSQSEYDAFRYNRQYFDCSCEHSSIDNHLPFFPNCYKEYSRN